MRLARAGRHRPRDRGAGGAAVGARGVRPADLLPRVRHAGAVLGGAGDELEHPVGLQRLLQLRPGRLLRRRGLRDARCSRAGTGWDFLATLPVAGMLAAVLGAARRLARLPAALAARRGLRAAHAGRALHPRADRPHQPADRRRPGDRPCRSQTIPEQPMGGFQDFAYLLSLAIAASPWSSRTSRSTRGSGWALFAIRDAEDVAEGLGVPTFRMQDAGHRHHRLHRRDGGQRLRPPGRVRDGRGHLQPDRAAVRDRHERARRAAATGWARRWARCSSSRCGTACGRRLRGATA